MKKIFSALILFALIFAGCSNSDSVSEKFLLASIFNQEEQGTEYKISVKQAESRVLGVNNSYLLDYLNDIVWTVSLYPSERNTYKEARSAYFQNLKADSNGNISFKMIKKGLYSIDIFGSYTDSEDVTYSFHAEKADVDLSENSGSLIDMEVSSVQNNGDEGSYSINVEFDMEIWGNDFLGESNLSFSLTNVSSTFDSGSITEEYISVTSSIKESKNIFKLEPNTSTSTGLAPGFYRLTVGLKEFQNGINTISLDNIPLSDSIIAINSDKITEGTVEAYYTYSLNNLRPYYYANSDSKSTGNGLYPETAGYVWNIVDTLISAPWQEDESVVVYCGDFVLDAKEYNSIVKDSAKSDCTFFSKKGSISVISSTGTYTISSYTVTVNNGKVVFADSSNTKSSLGVIKGYSRGDSDYIGVFENNVVLETALMPFSTCYIHNPENYLDKDNPFIRISNTHEEAQATYDSNYNFLTKLNSAITGASTLKLYVYDKAKKDYYYDLSFGVAVDTDYVNSVDTAPTGTYANLYLVKRGGSLISTKDSYYDLSINATGIYSGELETYEGSADAIFDWNDNASATIKFTANYNKDVSPSSFEWKLNGKSVGTGSTINLAYSQFITGTDNYISCTMKCGSDEVNTVMKLSFNETAANTDWVAFERSYIDYDESYVIDYYSDEGSSNIVLNNIKMPRTSQDSWNCWNLNDGYLYICQCTSSSISDFFAYKISNSSKKIIVDPNYAYSKFKNDIGSYLIVDMNKYNGEIYLLLKSTDSSPSGTDYCIAVCPLIAKSEVSGNNKVYKTDTFNVDVNYEGTALSLSQMAVYGNYVYLSFENGKTKGIYKIKINRTNNGLSIEDGTKIDDVTTAAIYSDSFPLKPIYSYSDLTQNYSDMAVVNGKLYVTMYSYSDAQSLYYTNLGAIACLSISNEDGSLTQEGLYGVNLEMLQDQGTEYTYAPSGKNPEYFYGVYKILAIKDDHILLQDGGIYTDNFISTSDLYFRNTDRVVYFDLSTSSINTEKTRTDFTIVKKSASGIVLY